MRIRTAFVALVCLGGLLANAMAIELPPIRSGPGNEVPACVGPVELMDFASNRNRRLRLPRKIDHRYDNLATLYQRIGRCVQRVRGGCQGVRWDFAFFQMLIETNYLTFRKEDGNPGGVHPEDNNFAGIGAHIVGRPGKKYPDIETGVLAHLQYILIYSGQRIIDPVTKKMSATQSYIVAKMKGLKRAVTFADLTKEWTIVDREGYARDIQKTAERFSQSYCRH